MTKEYIEREAAVAALKSLPFQWDVEDLAVYEAIGEVPIVDVAPVVHGEWITHGVDENSDLTILKCSVCGRKQFGYSNYCGDCGNRLIWDGGSK